MGKAMTATLKLYETVDALNVVREWIYENDEAIRAAEGALPDELAALLDTAEIDFKGKAENVALFIRELIANAKAVREERDRLDSRVKHYERAAESLKAYLKINMELADVPKVEGKLVTVRLQKSPPAVKVLLDQDTLGRMRAELHTALFVKTIPESFTVDTDYAKAVWKNGGELPQGIEVTQGQHVRIQ
jgi:hypothetical protein